MMSAIANVSSMLVQSARLNQNQMIQVASLNQQRSIIFIILGYHTGDLMFNGIHDKHRFLNRHLRTVAVTTPPPQCNLLYLHNNIVFTHLRQPINTISDKEYMALVIVLAG